MLSEDFVANLIKVYPFTEGKIAFDIGAHRGKFTELLASRFDKVYAFEPFPENVKVLKEKFADNPKVIIVEKAIHRKNGTERFYVNGETEQGSLSKLYAQSSAWNYNSANYIEVETITLDSFCENENVNPSLIKIDIEGAEQYIFTGATKTLQSLKPETDWIILECHLMVDWDMVTDMFKSFDFKFVNTELKTVEHLDPCNHYLIHKGDINFV